VKERVSGKHKKELKAGWERDLQEEERVQERCGARHPVGEVKR